jgi:DNA-binding CsgD family transcriptional regulator
MSQVGPLLSPVIVGRDEHVAHARRRVGEVLEGHGQLVLLSGEAGIGKSRLLTEIGRLAVDRGFRVAKGEVTPLDRDVLAASFLDLGRAMRRDAAFGTIGRDVLELSAARLTHARRRDYVMELVDLLGGSDKPTLLLFEDLQWADNLSLEALTELARQTRDRPLLIVATYRTSEARPGSAIREWRSRLVTQRLAEELRLDGLTRAQTGQIITRILGNGLPAPRDVIDAIYVRSDGVPLHIEELCSALGRERLASSRAVLEAEVPETIEDATLARMARLSPDAQATARAGAVIGRSFVPSVLAAIMDVPIAALDAPLQELVDHDVLDEVAERSQYDFRHQLLRDTIYRSVPVDDRRRFHARTAEFGGQLEGSSDIHASVHFERAGMTEDAFRTALAAAKQATAMSSHREAFELFLRAMHNKPVSLPDAQNVRFLLLYSEAAGSVDQTGPATEFAEQARTLALRIGDHLAAIEALGCILAMARRDGERITVRRDMARRMFHEIEAAPPSCELDEQRIFGLYLLALIEEDADQIDAARGLLLEAREVALRVSAVIDRSVSPELLAAGLWVDNYLAQLDVLEGRAAEGLGAIRSVGERVRAMGQEDTGVGCYLFGALMGMRAMDSREASLGLAEGLRYAESVQQTYFGHALASCEALLSWSVGQWDDALRQGGQALSDPGSGWSHDLARLAIGYVEAGRGRRAAAQAQLVPALEFGRHSERLDLILPALWGLAEAALHGGDETRAAALCDEALQAAQALGERTLIAPFAPLAVRAHQAAGRPDAAARWLEQVGRLADPGIAAPALQHATGLVRLAEGSTIKARAALEAAVTTWDERGRRWEALWARLDLAAALQRSSRFVDAARLVDEVRAAADAMGAAPLLARVEQLTRAAKGRGAKGEPWHPLTTREFEVARKVAEGLTNAKLAAELSISPKTASAHVEHILAKLGVSRRAEIAHWVATVGADRRPATPSRR